MKYNEFAVSDRILYYLSDGKSRTIKEVIGQAVSTVSPDEIRHRYEIRDGDAVIGWVTAEDAIIGSESGEGQDVILLDSEGTAVSIIYDAELVE